MGKHRCNRGCSLMRRMLSQSQEIRDCSPTATAKPPGGSVDSNSASSFEDRVHPKRRLICCVILVLLILGGVGGPLLGVYWDDVSLWFDEIASGTKAPQPAPPMPSAIPTPDSPAPSVTYSFLPTIG